MSDKRPDSAVVRFGDLTLDLRSGELTRNGSRLLLPEQPFRILARLVEQPGTLVTRDELRHALWADDTFVDFEHSLNAAIKRLREVIGDSAATPRFIETLPRRGYRFIAAVERVAPQPTEAAREAVSVSAEVLQAIESARRQRTTWIAIGIAAIFLATGVLALRVWRGRSAASGTFSLGRLTRLTSTPGLNVDPALSPDGSMLAYASDRAGHGNFDIWVQPVGGGTAIQITSDPADESEPSFSPDGAAIVFAKRETGGIYVVGTLGGESRLVVHASRARTPKLSPDGRWIAYWTGLPVGISRAAGASGALFVVSSAGGTPRAVLPDFASARHPIWSPDGRRLLFLGAQDPGPELDWYVVDQDGGDPRKTGAFDALRQAGAASIRDVPIPTAWTRDQTVLTSTTARTSSNVWQLPVSLDGRLAGAPQRLTFGTATERSPTATASGTIAFASLNENVDIWRTPLDRQTGLATGPMERMTDNPAIETIGNASGDGKVMAFVSSRLQQSEVWFKDLDTGRERQFTQSGQTAVEAQISPDGSKVAVWRGLQEKREVVIVESENRTSKICADCERSFGWSPDGSRVLFARASPSRLYIHDVATGRDALLAEHPKWFLRTARFSPDGRWVAFYAAMTPDERQVYVIPSSSQPVPQNSWIRIGNDVSVQPSWSDDGAKIYYFSERDGALCVWMQPLDSTKHPIGEARPVQHFHEPHLRAGTTAIATNDVRGGYLYVTLTETTGNIWLLNANP